MLFSCKISSALIKHLDLKSVSLEPLESSLTQKFDLPPLEFLRDPSCWLKAREMEDLLTYIQQHYQHTSEVSLLTLVGHDSKELRAWGVLDSVLRMLKTPQDVFLQPQRFLSYFISPPPPVANVKHRENSIRFDLPIAAHEFPCVVEYLKAAIESVPTYLGQSLANLNWDNSSIKIDWCTRQVELLEDQVEEKALHPELVQNILRDLEHSQKQIEHLQLSLRTKSEEIELLRKQPAVAPVELGHHSIENLHMSLQNIYRLADYMSRSQQLVTLLVAQNRATPQVKEAMRRVDWARVQGDTTASFKEVIQNLQVLERQLKQFASSAHSEGFAVAQSLGPDQTQFTL